MSRLHIEPTGATLGATVTGVSLAALDEPTWTSIYRAWLEHAPLIFPGQHLTNQQQIAFARRFGAIERIGGGEIVANSGPPATWCCGTTAACCTARCPGIWRSRG